LLGESLLHLYCIDGKSVFTRELRARRKVINLLALIESFVEVVLALCMRPEHVPVMAVCSYQTVDFKDEAYKFGLTLQHLIVDRRLAHLRVGVRGGP